MNNMTSDTRPLPTHQIADNYQAPDRQDQTIGNPLISANKAFLLPEAGHRWVDILNAFDHLHLTTINRGPSSPISPLA